MVLEPGNTALKKFTARTRQSTLFTPTIYTFHIEILYEISAKQNRDAVKQQFNVRSPIKALIQGSLWGSLMGTSIRTLKENKALGLSALVTPASAAALVGGLLLAGVLVVAFARKKDAQPFITIEDFWGGFFVGFVAGYVGTPALEKLLPSAGDPSTKQ